MPGAACKRRSSSGAVALAKKQMLETMAATKEQAQAVRAALADEARQQKAQAKAQAKAAAAAAKEAATRERLLAKLVKGAVAALLRRVRVDANARARAFEVACKAAVAARARAPRCAAPVADWMLKLKPMAKDERRQRAVAPIARKPIAKRPRAAAPADGRAAPDRRARRGTATRKRNADHGARARGESGARSSIFERDVCTVARRGQTRRFFEVSARDGPRTPDAAPHGRRHAAVRPGRQTAPRSDGPESRESF